MSRRPQLWRFGATPTPTREIGRWAQRFEALGWDGLAVGEDNGLLPDSYVALTQAAATTTTLLLGTGISNPIRHPLLAANVMLSLNAASGGRFTPSLGRGDGSVAQLGRGPLTVADFGTYLRRVVAYLRHENVDLDGYQSTLVRMVEADSTLAAASPSVDVSATGPRMIELAASVADGITFAVGANPARIRDCMERAHAARDRAGLDPASLGFGCYVPAAVVVGGDRTAARAVVRGGVQRHARFSAYDGQPLVGVAPEDADVMVRAARSTHHAARTSDTTQIPVDYFRDADHTDDDFVDRFGIIGEPQECAERLADIAATGVDRIVVITRVPGTDPNEDNAARLAQEVFPLLG